MADKTVSFEATGNHWYWRAKNSLDCQTGTVVTMPEAGKLTKVELKVAGLVYNDPVYGYQSEPGYICPAVWSASTGEVITKGAQQTVDKTAGGTQPWTTFNLADARVKEGQRLIVGFWRRSDSSGYSTQWDYCTDSSANDYETYAQHVLNSSSGPFTFDKSVTYSGRAINFRLHYEAGGKVHVWNGKSWVSESPKVYDGGWETGTVQVFDGTDWVSSTE